MSKLLDKIVSTQMNRSIIFIRLSVGLVFLISQGGGSYSLDQKILKALARDPS